MKLWLHRPISGKLKSASLSADARGRWYCNLNVEMEQHSDRPFQNAVGIDIGIKTTLALSSGETFHIGGVQSQYQSSLASAQRAKKRTLRRSIYAKIANSQRDLAHKATHAIVQKYDTVIVGSISASQLASLFPKQTADNKIGFIKYLLRYKAITRGCRYVEVSEVMTSRTCSSCGHVPEKWPKGIAGCEIREWTCDVCNANHDRDVNAARNILRLGHQALAEGTLGLAKGDATVPGLIAQK